MDMEPNAFINYSQNKRSGSVKKEQNVKCVKVLKWLKNISADYFSNLRTGTSSTNFKLFVL